MFFLTCLSCFLSSSVKISKYISNSFLMDSKLLPDKNGFIQTDTHKKTLLQNNNNSNRNKSKKKKNESNRKRWMMSSHWPKCCSDETGEQRGKKEAEVCESRSAAARVLYKGALSREEKGKLIIKNNTFISLSQMVIFLVQSAQNIYFCSRYWQHIISCFLWLLMTLISLFLI